MVALHLALLSIGLAAVPIIENFITKKYFLIRFLPMYFLSIQASSWCPPKTWDCLSRRKYLPCCCDWHNTQIFLSLVHVRVPEDCNKMYGWQLQLHFWFSAFDASLLHILRAFFESVPMLSCAL
jgi:hypothetical protein